MKQCWSAVLLGWIFHNISKTCGLRKEKWLLHQMMNTLICSVILSGFASVTDKDKQDRQNYCSKYCSDGKNTCEPDGAATKTSTLAKHLSSLGSGYMMSLVSHIRGPQCWLQHTHTHTGALVTLTVQIVWRYIDLYPAWSVTIYWLGGVETRGGEARLWHSNTCRPISQCLQDTCKDKHAFRNYLAKNMIHSQTLSQVSHWQMCEQSKRIRVRVGMPLSAQKGRMGWLCVAHTTVWVKKTRQ